MVVSRGSGGWHLRRAEQTPRPRIRRVAGRRHAHVRGEGVLARQRVVRLHRRPALQHRRTGLPAVRVRPLADPARRPMRAQQQTLRRRAGTNSTTL